jgi:hypothetical protein
MAHLHQTTRAGLLALAVTGALTAAAGCDSMNTPLYFRGPAILMTDGDVNTRASGGLTLRFRNPNDAERQNLDDLTASFGFDVPWISRDKVHVQLTYTIRNLSDQDGLFNLMVDGANEFTKYDSQIVSDAIAEDEPIFLPLVQSGIQTIGPGQVFQGILREDDFAEGELDLDALGRWLDPDPASPTFTGVLINRSDVNPVGLRPVSQGGVRPDNIAMLPALIEINVNLQADQVMSCEYAIRVRDDDDRLLHRDTDTLFETAPTLFQPPAAMN